jgi:hypothetical protein
MRCVHILCTKTTVHYEAGGFVFAFLFYCHTVRRGVKER